MSKLIIPVLVGLLLVTTSLLKLEQITSGGNGLIFTSLSLELLIVTFEMALGIGLLFWNRRCGLWPICVGSFLTFLGFNVRALWIGQTSCGCFGAIEASPWEALVLDLVVLAALIVWFRTDSSIREWRHVFCDGLVFGTGLIISLVIWQFGINVTFGSLEAARAAIRQEQIYLESSVINFGPIESKGSAFETLSVRNRSSETIRIVGGTSDCSCTLLSDLPVSIPPGEVRRIRVVLTAPKHHGYFRHTAKLWTDSETNDVLFVTLLGRSVGPS